MTDPMTHLTCPYIGRGWTGRETSCQSLSMTAADPLLAKRRHVDFLRVRSAICR